MTLRNTVLGAVALTMLAGVASAQDAVKIGYSIANTGLFSQAAPSQVTAYELWAEQVNAEGGLEVAGEKRPVELIWYDDESDPAKAAQIYEKLISDDEVDLLLAPWGTPHHLNVAGVVESHGFPMVGNTAASVAIREVSPGNVWFPTSAIPDKVGPELAAFAKSEGIGSVAILANVLPFAQENLQFLLPALEEQGIEVKMNENYPPDISDMTSLLAQVKASGADAVIALSYPADSFLYMGQAKELGIDQPFQFLLVGPTISAFQGAFGADADGIVTLGHWSPHQADWERAKPFYDAYVAKYGFAPDYLDSALAYMSAEILEAAVAQAGLDHEKLRDVISTSTFDTINGPVRFDGVENVETPTAFLQLQGGEMHLIWPGDIATSEYQNR
ncbi:amino acid ABC transporter substrate-binding protein [Ruegeria lacuscaerulensis]|uniref:amino acid ABC transporter substrate-binding protein n=1 Tax=Ruegeria lacuscaerulensis TaxID=55218 RepID=UPI00148188DB|nr:amino acid ABC transporter substrate-binding protein [Ruegeria lacuscaerulensis]